MFRTMAWLYLIIAGLFEVAWAIGLKYTDGFSRVWPSVLTILAMIISFGFLAQALKTIPVGTGYAVWTGIGAVGTATLGMFSFQNQPPGLGWRSIGLILAGIIALKATS